MRQWSKGGLEVEQRELGYDVKAPSKHYIHQHSRFDYMCQPQNDEDEESDDFHAYITKATFWLLDGDQRKRQSHIYIYSEC